MNEKILVIIPAHNEERNVRAVVEELRRDFGAADLLVVDDCSSDGTLQILRDMGVKHLSLPFNLGYSGAIQAGFKYAVARGFDYAVQFDGDGQHIAAEAERLFREIRTGGADIVIGSRFKEESGYRHAFLRRIGTKIFRFIIKRVCRQEVSDPTSGFQVLNRRVLREYAQMNHYPEFPDANLIIEMLFKGFKIQEIQVRMRERVHGESMHKGLFRPAKYMIEMFYSIVLILMSRRRHGRKPH